MKATEKNQLFPGTYVTIALTAIFVILSMSYTAKGTDSNYPNTIIIGIEQGTIKGIVKESGSNRVLDSALIILTMNRTQIATTYSHPDGSFVFTGVLIGEYAVHVTKKGYRDQLKKDIRVKANKTTAFTIKLKSLSRIVRVEKDDQEELQLSEISLRGKGRKCAMGAVSGAGYYTNNDQYAYIQHNTESYDKINENIFKDVLNNPLSTFSIDVDKASYSNVRRFINTNRMPYKDAVRVEELINYFNYDYPQPTNGDPFSVSMEMGECPWNKKHELVMIGIQGEELTTESIPAGNLVFLLDVSGSMSSPNKLPLLKQAFKILVNNLRNKDKVAIVVYAGAAGCVLESTSGSEKTKIIAALDRLEAGGSTAGGAGIKLAYKIAKENYIPGGNNRVILATDGDFNIGASSDSEMTRLIEEKREEGVFLSILGFGMGNYKDSKMETISNAGNGNYAYIDNIMEAKKVFGTELWGTLYTIAKDVKIQVEFNPEKVKAYRLIGYENRILNKEDFNDDKKDAGDIGCGHTVTALYEIVLAGSDEQVSNVDPLEYQDTKVKGGPNLMTLKLRYKHPEDTISKLIVMRIKEKDIKKTTASDNLKFATAVAEFGMLLRDSEHKGDANYQQTLALAKDSRGEDEYGYRSDFIKMVEAAELLSK